MPYSVEAKNAMLDHLGTLALWMMVHTANPGSTGANPCTGTTRQAVTWNAAAGGAKTQSNTPSFANIPVAEGVTHISLWSASTGGTYYGYHQVTATTVSGSGTWTYDVSSGSIDLNAVASA